ncbi:MAG: hypothetical protein ACWGQW_22985 [bacterium]
MTLSVAIATKVYDLAGRILMLNVDETASQTRTYERRVTRTATLDTGAYIDDRGYFAGDRTINVSLSGSKELFEALRYILENYSSLWISLPDGAYSGNMSRLTISGNRIRFTLLLEGDA